MHGQQKEWRQFLSELSFSKCLSSSSSSCAVSELRLEDDILGFAEPTETTQNALDLHFEVVACEGTTHGQEQRVKTKNKIN